MTKTLFGDDEWPKLPPPAPPCEHIMVPVLMPDGRTIYASRHHSSRGADEMRPDFGFYLDSVWHPDCIAWYTHWADFGVPTLELPKFVEMLGYILDQTDGWALEVGCIGGHGRTGTALACFCVVLGDTPGEAIDRIRTEYCFKAVETEVQEWFVEAVHCQINGLEIPAKPEPPVTSYTQTYNWHEEGRSTKDENKGKTAKVNTDAAGQEYCSMCLVDIPSADTLICVWCGAALKAGDD